MCLGFHLPLSLTNYACGATGTCVCAGAVVGVLPIVLLWCFVGAHFALSVGLSDFCVAPEMHTVLPTYSLSLSLSLSRSLSLSLSPTQPSLSSLDHSHSPPPTPPARPLSPLSAAGTGGAIGHCGRCVTQHDHSVRAVQRHQHSGSASRHSQRLGGSLPPVSGTPPSAGPSTATVALRSNCQVRIEVVRLQPHLTSQSVNVRFGKPPPRE
jgi:hypothetical protein